MAVFAVAAALLLCLTSVSADGDFMFVVQQWSKACSISGGCCNQPSTPAFTLHGMWPNYQSGGYPQDCGGSSYDRSAISDLTSTMDTVWPTFKCGGSEDDFWGHEYDKHGTCAMQGGQLADDGAGPVHTYFNAALAAQSATDLKTTLANAGITPGRSYSKTAILNAIQNDYGTAYIECDKKGTLMQVYTCVDMAVANLISCPAKPGAKSCPTQVKY